MIEYPARIYKKGRNKGYIANCVINNITGFGKTEEDAINNLKECIQKITKKTNIIIKPFYGFSIAQ